MGTLTISKANTILREHLPDTLWYFEKRNDKIWFIEKLKNTYNRIFNLNNPSGANSKDVLDYHVRQAISFVLERRQWKNRHIWDKRGKIISGFQADDKEGRKTLPDEI